MAAWVSAAQAEPCPAFEAWHGAPHRNSAVCRYVPRLLTNNGMSFAAVVVRTVETLPDACGVQSCGRGPTVCSDGRHRHRGAARRCRGVRDDSRLTPRRCSSANPARHRLVLNKPRSHSALAWTNALWRSRWLAPRTLKASLTLRCLHLHESSSPALIADPLKQPSTRGAATLGCTGTN